MALSFVILIFSLRALKENSPNLGIECGHVAQCLPVLPPASPRACFLWKQRRRSRRSDAGRELASSPQHGTTVPSRAPSASTGIRPPSSRQPTATKSELARQRRHGASPIWSAATCRSFPEATCRREDNQLATFASIAPGPSMCSDRNGVGDHPQRPDARAGAMNLKTVCWRWTKLAKATRPRARLQ